MFKSPINLALILMMTVSCVHCGMEDDFYVDRPVIIDEEIKQYLTEFHRDRRHHGAPKINSVVWQLRYVNADEAMLDGNTMVKRGAVGVCYLINERLAFIYIHKWVKSIQEPLKRMVMYHEFGHCMMGLDHHDNGDIDIMNSELPVFSNGNFIKAIWPSLLEDFFSRSTGHVAIEKSDHKTHDFHLKDK